MIGVAGPQLGNLRGGVLGAFVGAQAAEMVGGFVMATAAIAVGAATRPLREYVRPSDECSETLEKNLKSA